VKELADGAGGLSDLVNAAAEETTHRVFFGFKSACVPGELNRCRRGWGVGDTDAVLPELLSEKGRSSRFQMWNGHLANRLGSIYRTTKKFLSS